MQIHIKITWLYIIFFTSFNSLYATSLIEEHANFFIEERTSSSIKIVFHRSVDSEKKNKIKNKSSLNADILMESYDNTLPNFTLELNLLPKPKSTNMDDQFNNRFRILLVEDNLILQKIGISILKKYNFNVDLAVNGRQALEYASRNRYNLVLMDIMMPVMNGIEATKELKKNDLTRHIPIIAYTASVTPEVILQAFAAGCCEIVEKGDKMSKQLINLIKVLLVTERP